MTGKWLQIDANVDRITEVRNPLPTPVLARYVRFLPRPGMGISRCESKYMAIERTVVLLAVAPTHVVGRGARGD